MLTFWFAMGDMLMADEEIKKTFYNLEKRQKDFQCSLGFTMTVIGSKWRAIILWHILQHPYIRYGGLKQEIPYISDKELAKELRYLVLDHLIERIQYPVIPPRVEYVSTPRGESLHHVMEELCFWGKQFMDI